ncbi:MAG TPA: manganese efflux pump MntP family protein [Kofleriaceae bacterium]|nr:manganese efflux pump MntP family protein [Kofleriaceae bacterium]
MWEAVGLGFGLAMDATAVSAARGLRRAHPSEAVILPLLFGVFQAGMAALGWLAGRWAGKYIEQWDHWIAAALLVGIGGKMLWEAWRGGDDDAPERTGLLVYLALAIATSIDAAAAGITLPLVAAPPWLTLTLIGGITTACCVAGYFLGKRAGSHFGSGLEVLGGLVLIAIAVRLLVQHL